MGGGALSPMSCVVVFSLETVLPLPLTVCPFNGQKRADNSIHLLFILYKEDVEYVGD